jgi:hypothetical protein
MNFTGSTPESLIPRSDSRNPATTCKGITASGRPCRRPLSSKAPKQGAGVLAFAPILNSDQGAAAYFCWQHKDQAEQLIQKNSGKGNIDAIDEEDIKIVPLQERTSLDSLAQKLGVLETADESLSQRKLHVERRYTREGRIAPIRRHGKLPRSPPSWDKMEGPLMSIPNEVIVQCAAERPSRQSRPLQKPERKTRGFWSSICCGQADDDYVEVVRHRHRSDGRLGQVLLQPSGSTSLRLSSQSVDATPTASPAQSVRPYPLQNTMPYPDEQLTWPIPVARTRKPLGEKPARQTNKRTISNTETTSLLSLIPEHIPPQTASLLMAELSKPISRHDDEGYIYIFWLTDELTTPPPAKTASSLLTPQPLIPQGRRTSDVMLEYSNGSRTSGSRQGKQGTILLKIGRASNVHRRMNEWTRQCGYSLSLVRFYPYVPSSPSPSPSPSPAATPPANDKRRSPLQTPSTGSLPSPGSRPRPGPSRLSSGNVQDVRKVPHAHRVERLIQIELSDKRVKRNCAACGKEHREWFEVGATRKGIEEVDEVVRRWVRWAENMQLID